jgi:hypothetical protein
MKNIVPYKHPKYNWIFAKDSQYVLRTIDNKVIAVARGKYDKIYARIINSKLIIYKGYACDGCTLAPDFCRAIEGCCVHDALYQIIKQNPGIFTEEQANQEMRHIHKHKKFKLASIYYWAVSGLPRKIYKLWNRH